MNAKKTCIILQNRKGNKSKYKQPILVITAEPVDNVFQHKTLLIVE